MRVWLMLAVAMILTGCASAPVTYKAPTPERQAVLDQVVAKCRYEAEVGATSAGAGAVGAIEVEYRKVQARKELFHLCTESKGWRLER